MHHGAVDKRSSEQRFRKSNVITFLCEKTGALAIVEPRCAGGCVSFVHVCSYPAAIFDQTYIVSNYRQRWLVSDIQLFARWLASYLVSLHFIALPTPFLNSKFIFTSS